MDQGVHFISGLPRAGSTLLSSILRQNPRFHATISSPAAAMYMALEGAMSRRHETSVFLDDAQKQSVLRGLFDNYYFASHPSRVVFDSNRFWCSKLPAIARLFPSAKVICCVRPIGWIMDSIERLIRQNAFDLSSLFEFKPGGTVYTRVNRLAQGDGLVGFSVDALREAFYGEQSDRLLLVDYEALARDPKGTLAQLYAFLGEAPYAHDFDDVAYDADAMDLPMGTPGLHRVRGKVAWRERPIVLPPELFARFANDAFWLQPEAMARTRARIVRLPAGG